MMSQEGQERRKHGCFYYGCLTVLMLVLLGAAAGVGVYFYGRAQFGPMCEQYLALVEKGDYRAAYDSLGPQWRKGDTFEDYEKFEKAVRVKLGSCRTKKITNVDVSARSGRDTYAQITYDATFENGGGVITFTILKEQGGWLIEGVHYDSPILETLLKCPSCGAPLRGWVKFCPECGKPVAAASDRQTTGALSMHADETSGTRHETGQTTHARSTESETTHPAEAMH
jgi:hypothetical protein